MTRRVFLPPSRETAPGSELPGTCSAEVEQLIAAGREEAPLSELEQRVRDAVAYRRLLADARPPWLQHRARPYLNPLSLGVGALAVAASAVLWSRSSPHKSPLSIAPEPALARSTTPAAPAAVKVAAPLSDPCRERAVASGQQPLIDDFEDGDDEVLAFENRAGLWRWARDTDSPGSAPALLPVPRVNGHAGNRMALHVKGGHLLDWGAVVEFNFKPSCYDASAYRGLTFQAKGPGRVFVAPREVGTIPLTEGGTCTSDCYNPHVKKIELEKQWKSYRIEWAEFEQRGYGRPPFDPKHLHSIAFLIRPEDTPYDLWFDDVSFIKQQR
jgi:hypothetical protein